MAAVHAHSITHRDLNPNNILLDGTTTAMVTDFGIATSEMTKSCTSAHGQGIARYNAPETFSGRWPPSLDVYSFGVIVWQVTTIFLFLHVCHLKKNTEWWDLIAVLTLTHHWYRN